MFTQSKSPVSEPQALQKLAALRNVIAAKRRTTKAASDYELNAKLMRHALSRGFTMRLIEQCVDTPD